MTPVGKADAVNNSILLTKNYKDLKSDSYASYDSYKNALLSFKKPENKVEAKVKPPINPYKDKVITAKTEQGVVNDTELSERFIKSVIKEEGFKLEEYTINGVRTIGVGHNMDADKDPAFKPRKDGKKITITKEQAYKLLAKDLVAAEERLFDITNGKFLNLNQGQKESLIDISFNVKPTTLDGSELIKCIKNGDINGAITKFNFIKAGKNINTGLCARRIQNVYLFSKDCSNKTHREIAMQAIKNLTDSAKIAFKEKYEKAESLNEKKRINNQKADFIKTSQSMINRLKTTPLEPKKKSAPTKKSEQGTLETIKKWFSDLFN